MNIVLWILQGVVAFYCLAGAAWRFFSTEQASQVASIASLPRGVWNTLGAVEFVLALGLILPGIIGWKGWTAHAALLLTIELLVVTAIHARHFGLKVEVTNPAMWTLGLAILSAFIAYGRYAVRPL